MGPSAASGEPRVSLPLRSTCHCQRLLGPELAGLRPTVARPIRFARRLGPNERVDARVVSFRCRKFTDCASRQPARRAALRAAQKRAQALVDEARMRPHLEEHESELFAVKHGA